METLTVGVIGTWGHLGTALGEVADMPEVRVVGVARGVPDDDLDALRKRFPATAHAPAYDDPTALLKGARPQLVIVSTRLDRIAPLATEAAEAGCHLVCEKPLAIDHDALKKLFDVVRARRVACIPMLHNRVHPVLRAAKRVVRDGAIGKVALVNARKSYKWGDRPQWFGRRETYGGTIPWVGIHALDFITEVTGQDVATVAGMHANAAHPDRPGCEDNAAIVMRLSDGAHATASVDLLRPAAAPTHGDDWVRVVGSGGVIEASLDKNTCTLITADKPPHDVPLPPAEPFYRPLLLGLLRHDAAPAAADTFKGFRLTNACLVARDAADRHQVLPVDAGNWV